MHGRLREDGIPSMIVYSIVLRISRFSCLFFLVLPFPTKRRVLSQTVGSGNLVNISISSQSV